MYTVPLERASKFAEEHVQGSSVTAHMQEILITEVARLMTPAS